MLDQTYLGDLGVFQVLNHMVKKYLRRLTTPADAHAFTTYMGKRHTCTRGCGSGASLQRAAPMAGGAVELRWSAGSLFGLRPPRLVRIRYIHSWNRLVWEDPSDPERARFLMSFSGVCWPLQFK